MQNVNYLLIEANKIKLGGYDVVPIKFLLYAVDYIYSDCPERGSKLATFYTKKQNNGYVRISDLCTEFPYNKAYLLDCEESGQLRYFCMQGIINANYAELVFILLVCGIGKSSSILRYFKNVSAVTSRIRVKSKNYNEKSVQNTSVISGLWVTGGFYCKLMSMYIENASRGVSYGFGVYDFIYHIVKTCGKRWDKIDNYLSRLSISSWSCFEVNSKDVLSKYKEEIACMIPYIYGNISLNKSVYVRLLSLVDFRLQGVVYSNSMFLEKTYRECTVEM